eukprot:8271524-Lingulodinium_polyedra.AAC.1
MSHVLHLQVIRVGKKNVVVAQQIVIVVEVGHLLARNPGRVNWGWRLQLRVEWGASYPAKVSEESTSPRRPGCKGPPCSGRFLGHRRKLPICHGRNRT